MPLFLYDTKAKVDFALEQIFINMLQKEADKHGGTLYEFPGTPNENSVVFGNLPRARKLDFWLH